MDELLWGVDVDSSSDPKMLQAKAKLFEGAAGGSKLSQQGRMSERVVFCCGFLNQVAQTKGPGSMSSANKSYRSLGTFGTFGTLGTCGTCGTALVALVALGIVAASTLQPPPYIQSAGDTLSHWQT